MACRFRADTQGMNHVVQRAQGSEPYATHNYDFAYFPGPNTDAGLYLRGDSAQGEFSCYYDRGRETYFFTDANTAFEFKMMFG